MDMQSMLQKMKERANAQKSKPMKRPDRLMRSSAEESAALPNTSPNGVETAATSEINNIEKKVSVSEKAEEVIVVNAPAEEPVAEKPLSETIVTKKALIVETSIEDSKLHIEKNKSHDLQQDQINKTTAAVEKPNPVDLRKQIQTTSDSTKRTQVNKNGENKLVSKKSEIIKVETKETFQSAVVSNVSIEDDFVFEGSNSEPSSNQVQTRFNNNDKEIENSLNLVQTGFKPSSEIKDSTDSKWNAEKIDLNAQNEPLLQNLTEPTYDMVISEFDSTEFEPSSNQVQTRFNGDLDLATPINGEETKKESTKSRTRFKPSSNQVQHEFRQTTSESLKAKPSSEPGSNLVSTEFKVGSQPSSKILLHKLSPLQISILKYMHSICEIERSDTTTPIKAFDIVNSCQCTLEGAKTAIKRMLKSEIIKRIDYKDGRGGWCQYQIPENIHSRILIDLKPSFNLVQTRFNPSSEPGSEPGSTLPSKLVSNINNNLLTKEDPETPSLEVGLINIQALTKFGITRKQIQDISNQKLAFTTHTLQDFIDRFEIYVSDPKNIRGVNSVPAIFVKMAQLASKGNDPLIDVETETDRVIRERIERLKARQEERLRQENELLSLEFENWYSGLGPKEMDEAAPPNPASKSGSSTQKIILKSYFLEKLWPELRATLGL
jgi:hypothetical protein